MKSQLTQKEYLKEITTLGTNLKNKIIYEAYNEPDKFIPLKETEKANMTETIFVEGILAKTLINNNIIVSIEKETSNKDLSLTMLQLLSSGEAFKKVLNITYDYGEKQNAKILIDNKITVSIEKKTSNKDLALTMLQLLSSGEAFQKIINITYDYGEEKNAKIIIDKIEKENFINTKKKKYLFH